MDPAVSLEFSSHIQWASTQQQLQQTIQRNTFGLSVPLRQAMDLKIVSDVSDSAPFAMKLLGLLTRLSPLTTPCSSPRTPLPTL